MKSFELRSKKRPQNPSKYTRMNLSYYKNSMSIDKKLINIIFAVFHLPFFL